MYITQIISINAHSWLHCVDYKKTASLKVGTINKNFCNALARGISNNSIFGVDNGYNYQPENNIACKDKYDGKNIVKMYTGNSYRFLWPAKNHISVKCTNPYITDISLKLYFYNIADLNNPDPLFSLWTKKEYLFFDLKNSGNGFQNCPYACPETDKVPCYGDIPIPENIIPGFYKAIWVWNFNPNEFFTHCIDIQIISTTTKAPSLSPTTKAPSLSPTTKAPSLY